MKVLFITFVPPGFYNGGQKAILNSLLLISEVSDVTYIGPQCNMESITKKLLLPNPRMIDYLIAAIKMHTSGYRRNFQKAIKSLRDEYDIVWLETSKLDVTKSDFRHLKRAKIITRMHNHEYTYYRELRKIKPGIKTYLLLKIMEKRERRILEFSDEIISLTEVDAAKTKAHYGLKKELNVFPLHILDPGWRVGQNISKGVVFFGALNFSPNIEGIKWFLQNVWDGQKLGRLLIGGRSPSPDFISFCSKFDSVTLMPDIADPWDIYQLGSVVIAPIFSGSGQKVKIAEALAYGKIVITSQHASIGYEDVDSRVMRIARDNKSFIQAIEEITSCEEDYLVFLGKLAYSEYKRLFTAERAKREYHEIINKAARGAVEDKR